MSLVPTERSFARETAAPLRLYASETAVRASQKAFRARQLRMRCSNGLPERNEIVSMFIPRTRNRTRGVSRCKSDCWYMKQSHVCGHADATGSHRSSCPRKIRSRCRTAQQPGTAAARVRPVSALRLCAAQAIRSLLWSPPDRPVCRSTRAASAAQFILERFVTCATVVQETRQVETNAAPKFTPTRLNEKLICSLCFLLMQMQIATEKRQMRICAECRKMQSGLPGGKRHSISDSDEPCLAWHAVREKCHAVDALRQAALCRGIERNQVCR